jgi:hypothetical protein
MIDCAEILKLKNKLADWTLQPMAELKWTREDDEAYHAIQKFLTLRESYDRSVDTMIERTRCLVATMGNDFIYNPAARLARINVISSLDDVEAQRKGE